MSVKIQSPCRHCLTKMSAIEIHLELCKIIAFTFFHFFLSQPDETFLHWRLIYLQLADPLDPILNLRSQSRGTNKSSRGWTFDRNSREIGNRRVCWHRRRKERKRKRKREENGKVWVKRGGHGGRFEPPEKTSWRTAGRSSPPALSFFSPSRARLFKSFVVAAGYDQLRRKFCRHVATREPPESRVESTHPLARRSLNVDANSPKLLTLSFRSRFLDLRGIFIFCSSQNSREILRACRLQLALQRICANNVCDVKRIIRMNSGSFEIPKNFQS